jgi:PAB-dependent poly(A)-specific ribonuclease subunit 2
MVSFVAQGEPIEPLANSQVTPSCPETQDDDQWHLFNDFLVHPTTEEELRFDPSWKMPSVLAYQLKSARHDIDNSWLDNLDMTLLYRSEQDMHPDQFQPLSQQEAPKQGTLVGIDAEFVSLQSEEIEIKADGTRETIRPRRLGLARVSVLRGDGEKQDLPFIDDYVAVTEPVVDYLTAFSGISAGDLTRGVSRHVLVNLYEAYKKLWLLLNLGCVFVGHGLLKDFRTINMHVPRGQVIDTVDLWFIPYRGRKLNLRYLAWYLLHEDIQIDTHDSVEDARTALRLARKYNQVQLSGRMEETLDAIYKKGKEVGFRAPGSQTGLVFPLAGPDTGTGRNTPEPSSEARTSTGTPAKKTGFAGDRKQFGSPLRGE